jgi:hypothetical protein
MGQIDWAISGDYLETCSCNYVCPCVASNLRDKPTHGWCKAALLFHIKKGHYGKVSLDNLAAVVVGYIPGALIEGNWTVGLIISKEASAEQREALTSILTGSAGGPMERFAPLVGTFAGVETGAIQFEKSGMRFSFSIPGVLDQAAEGVGGGANPDEPLYVDNNLHWANTRLGLAKASRSHLHAFGIDWDDTSGRNNGVYAPFQWHGTATTGN